MKYYGKINARRYFTVTFSCDRGTISGDTMFAHDCYPSEVLIERAINRDLGKEYDDYIISGITELTAEDYRSYTEK